jgi:hypothetical protein
MQLHALTVCGDTFRSEAEQKHEREKEQKNTKTRWIIESKRNFVARPTMTLTWVIAFFFRFHWKYFLFFFVFPLFPSFHWPCDRSGINGNPLFSLSHSEKLKTCSDKRLTEMQLIVNWVNCVGNDLAMWCAGASVGCCVQPCFTPEKNEKKKRRKPNGRRSEKNETRSTRWTEWRGLNSVVSCAPSLMDMETMRHKMIEHDKSGGCTKDAKKSIVCVCMGKSRRPSKPSPRVSTWRQRSYALNRHLVDILFKSNVSFFYFSFFFACLVCFLSFLCGMVRRISSENRIRSRWREKQWKSSNVQGSSRQRNK